MNARHNPSSAICNRRLEARAADAQAQIEGPKRPNQPVLSGSSWRATLPLRWLFLAGVVTLAAGINRAGADDHGSFRETIQAQIVSSIGNSDGSADQVFTGTGTATHAGAVTAAIYVHVGIGSYDPEANAWVSPLTGTKTITAANGHTMYSDFAGAETTRFDAHGNPQPPPLHFAADQHVLGGTGRFEGATGSLETSGLDYGNGAISFASSGILSLSEAEPGTGPIVVRIHDLGYPKPPEVEVDGAVNGWGFCPCANLGIIDPANEDGGVITLFGVDRYGSINEPGESGWRFLDPTLPQPTCLSAVDIVWIQHDYFGPFNNGDLQVAFNSALPGHYYKNPAVCPQFADVSLGPLTYKWQLVYADATVAVLFKAQK